MRLSFVKLLFFLLSEVSLSPAFSQPQSTLPTTARSSSSGAKDTITATPTLSCDVQFEDPDQGILSEFCVCNGTDSLPLMTPTSAGIFNDLSDSCVYETVPVSLLVPAM